MTREAPLPPAELALRVGGTHDAQFDDQGSKIRDCIIRCLPEDFDFKDKRVLDFGCGAGRVLRHFAEERSKSEFWACDIHEPSVRWISETLPDCRAFLSSENPGLPFDADVFDLIYVISVFTHLTSNWREWLDELQRVLKPGGILINTFHNRVAYERLTGKRFDDSRAEMLVLSPDNPWDEGGPMVYHSNSWIEANWGAALNVEFISREALLGWQSVAVLSKPDNAVSRVSSQRPRPLLQPYPYQLYNPDFEGSIRLPIRTSPYLKNWHGLEVNADTICRAVIGGSFASRRGVITQLEVTIDGRQIAKFSTVSSSPPARGVILNRRSPMDIEFETTLNLQGYSKGEYDLRIRALDSTGQSHEIEYTLVVSENSQNASEPMVRPAVPEGRKEHISETILYDFRQEITPRLTVTVSLYNYRQYVNACLDSVCAQTINEIELIIVDDHSTDDSADVAAQWLSQHYKHFARARLVQHSVNHGLAFARNTAFRYADSPFVFVLDADNLLYPRCLERLLDALGRCDATFAYCLLEKFGDQTGLENTRTWNPAALQFGNFIDAMVLFRRKDWEAVGGYATDMPAMGWEDFELWFRLANAGGWGIQVPEILARYRVRRNSMLHVITNPNANLLWDYLRKKYPNSFHI